MSYNDFLSQKWFSVVIPGRTQSKLIKKFLKNALKNIENSSWRNDRWDSRRNNLEAHV